MLNVKIDEEKRPSVALHVYIKKECKGMKQLKYAERCLCDLLNISQFKTFIFIFFINALQ